MSVTPPQRLLTLVEQELDRLDLPLDLPQPDDVEDCRSVIQDQDAAAWHGGASTKHSDLHAAEAGQAAEEEEEEGG